MILRSIVVVAACAVVAGSATAATERSLRGMSAAELERRLGWQERRLDHHRSVIRWFTTRGVTGPAGKPLPVASPRYRVWWNEKAVVWTTREIGETKAALAVKTAVKTGVSIDTSVEVVVPPSAPDDWSEFSCIHGHEGAADSNTGNGYYGGVQMDIQFQRTYGPEFVAQWGTADNWPVWAQVAAARRARDGYNGIPARGYGPWPNTARMCGQL